MPYVKKTLEDRIADTAEEIHDLSGGKNLPARERTREIARYGVQHELRDKDQLLSKMSHCLIQYRACRALCWSKTQILKETGWSHQWYLSVKKAAEKQDREIWGRGGADPIRVFVEYREQQLLAVKELEDLAIAFRQSSQFSALVSAIKTRSEILDKILKTGQDLGVIKRSAREVKITGGVEIKGMTLAQLQVTLSKEMSGLRQLLGPAKPELSGPAAKVLQRVLDVPAEVELEEDPNPARVPKTKAPRVKRVKSQTPISPGK